MTKISKRFWIMSLWGGFGLLLAAEVFGAPSVSLDQTLYFPGPGGKPVELTAGMYEVEGGQEEGPHAVWFSGNQEKKMVLANPIVHEEDIESSVALVLLRGRGTAVHHFVEIRW